MDSTDEDFLFDVGDKLKERSERYRIGSNLFEDVDSVKDSNEPKLCTGETCPQGNVDVTGVLKLGQTTQSITFEHYGVDIFDFKCAGNIYDEAKLHSNLCEAKPPNMINHPLFNISSSELHEVIQRGLLKQQIKKRVIYNNLNKYLFYLMSCNRSELLANACCDTLIYQLMANSSWTSPNTLLWRPSVDDIALVFCNYGASKEVLLEWDIPLPRVSRNKMVKDPTANQQLKNIPLVLKVISILLAHHKSTYCTTKELDRLLCMILTVSIDKHIMQGQLMDLPIECSKCLKNILAAYPSSKWKKEEKISDLIQKIYCKLRNVIIGDVYFIISNYISCPGIGLKLAMSLSYLFVRAKVCEAKPIKHLGNVEMKHILKIFNVDSFLEMDYYTQYYVLLILERAITNLVFTSEDVEDVGVVIQRLSNLRIKSSHSEDMVDYLLVKVVATRAATILKLGLPDVA